MDAAAGQDGIQRLLQAEQEAQAIVARARKGEPARQRRRRRIGQQGPALRTGRILVQGLASPASAA